MTERPPRRSDEGPGRHPEDERDGDLHRLMARGERSGFEALYLRYAGAAYGLALRVTGQQLLAEEVVHDSFLALWRAPEAYDPARGPFRTFFLSLVHHRAVDTVRREERLRRRSQRMNPGPAVDEDVAEGVVNEAWLAERRTQIRAALAALPPDQRQVVEMAYFQGLTQVRIAEALGIPLGTVKTRTLAAMHKLHRTLAGRDE
jgi:RNA polymerase sigma factor (sigma-70 family)